MEQSFAQQPKESAKAFAAFSLYLASREALARFHDKGNGATLGDIARILELASTIGRRASGLVTDKTEVTGADGGAIRVELEAALKKVYGQAELGSNVVDVEAVPLLTEGK